MKRKPVRHAPRGSFGTDSPRPSRVKVTHTKPTCSVGDVRFPYGKYDGLTIAETYKVDPEYVEWCALLHTEEHPIPSLFLNVSKHAAKFLAERER